MATSLRLLGVVVLAVGVTALAGGDEKPPWQRELRGEEAKKAANLKRRIDERAEADQYAEGIQAAEELLALRRRTQGDDHHEVADAQWKLEELRKVATLPAEQREEWRQVARGQQAARSLVNQGRYALALPALERLLNLRRQVLGDDHPDTAAIYNNVARIHDFQAKYLEAEPLYRKALSIYQKTVGEDHPSTAMSYNNLARTLGSRGKTKEAEQLNRKALAIYQHALGEAHPHTARSYNNLAVTLNAQGKLAEAETLDRKVLFIFQKNLGDYHLDTAGSYNNLALNLRAQGKHAEAEHLVRKALAIRQKALGDDHPDTATSYNNVASNLYFQGKYSEAELLAFKALTIHQRVLGKDHPDTARSYENVARVLTIQGKHAAAEPLHRTALVINQGVLGEDHARTARSYSGLAVNLDAQGKHAAAEPLHHKALAIRQKTLGDDHIETAESYDDAGLNKKAQCRLEEAEPFFYKALAISKKELGQDHPTTAACYNNVGVNLHAQRKYAEAEPVFRTSLAIWQRLLGNEHPHTATGYVNLAANLDAQGKHVEALASLEKAARSFETARLRVSRVGLDRAVALAERTTPWPPLAVGRLRDGHALSAWKALESHLGRGVLEEVVVQQLSPKEPSGRQEQVELSRKLDQLVPQILALVSQPAPSSTARTRLAELLDERARHESSLAALMAQVVRREMADLQAVQARLPTDAAMVAWLDVSDFSGAVMEHWACVVRKEGPPRWQRLPGTGPHGDWSQADGRLSGQVRVALGQRSAGVPASVQKLYAQRLEPIAKHLEGVNRLIVLPAGSMAGVPIEALTGRFVVSYAPSATLFARLQPGYPRSGTRRLLALGDPAFSPPEGLAKPLSMLPDHGLYVSAVLPESAAAKGGLRAGDVLLRYGGHKLAQYRDFDESTKGTAVPIQVWREGETLERFVPPGKLGVHFSRRPAAEEVRSRREVAAALERSQRGGDFPPLPGTRREVAALAALFPEHDVLLGRDASEVRLEQWAQQDQLKRYRILHFATHGQVDDRSMRGCALILSQLDVPDKLQQNLAGKKVYDGKLDVGEILDDWKLDADLVTLSACQTGLGQAGQGEGLMGFSQALLSRGARSVVVSLWKVDDTATALLMLRFYQNFLGKRPGLDKPLPKAEALREAKDWLRMLSAQAAQKQAQGLPGAQRVGKAAVPPDPELKGELPYAHPYYWAAFILIGDPD